MDGELLKKRGRPRKDDGRVHKVSLRLNDKEYDMLVEASETTGQDVSEVLRMALRSYQLSRRVGQD